MVDNSQITLTKGGGYIAQGHDATRLVRVKYLITAIKMHRKNGMIMTRGATISFLLAQAYAITGKKYHGKGKHERAIADLETWASTMESALPVVDERS